MDREHRKRYRRMRAAPTFANYSREILTRSRVGTQQVTIDEIKILELLRKKEGLSITSYTTDLASQLTGRTKILQILVENEFEGIIQAGATYVEDYAGSIRCQYPQSGNKKHIAQAIGQYVYVGQILGGGDWFPKIGAAGSTIWAYDPQLNCRRHLAEQGYIVALDTRIEEVWHPETQNGIKTKHESIGYTSIEVFTLTTEDQLVSYNYGSTAPIKTVLQGIKESIRSLTQRLFPNGKLRIPPVSKIRQFSLPGEPLQYAAHSIDGNIFLEGFEAEITIFTQAQWDPCEESLNISSSVSNIDFGYACLVPYKSLTIDADIASEWTVLLDRGWISDTAFPGLYGKENPDSTDLELFIKLATQ
jgi:hypothetical protein